ncbi:MAG TPA: hypothetical protein VK149_04260 [Sideroxyarcus sp.]|nr:hypothetical protein [Sideroxyarcus sp.]
MNLDALLADPPQLSRKPCKYGLWLESLSPEHVEGLERLHASLSKHAVWKYLATEVGVPFARSTYERHVNEQACGCFA